MNFVMNQMGQPVTIYESKEEMYYNMFLEMGLFVNQQGYLQDQDTGIVIRYKDQFIKVSLNPNVPVYTGRTDVEFDPKKNFNLMATLMGYYIDKREHGEEPIGYISQGIFDKKEEQLHSVFIKSQSGLYESDLYHNSYLGFIDCIFKMGGILTNLHPFDIVEDEEETKRRRK
jgi:hypothetical protein